MVCSINSFQWDIKTKRDNYQEALKKHHYDPIHPLKQKCIPYALSKKINIYQIFTKLFITYS